MEVVALVRGIPDKARRLVSDAVEEAFGSAPTINEPSTFEDALYDSDDAVKSARVRVVVYNVEADAYLGNSAVKTSGKYFCYKNNDKELAVWLDDLLGSSVASSVVSDEELFGGSREAGRVNFSAEGLLAGHTSGRRAEDAYRSGVSGGGEGAYLSDSSGYAYRGEGSEYHHQSKDTDPYRGEDSEYHRQSKETDSYRSKSTDSYHSDSDLSAERPSPGYSQPPELEVLDLRAQIKTLKAQIATQEDSLNTLKKQYASQYAVLNDLQKEKSKAEEDVSLYQSRVDSLQDRLDRAERRSDRAESKLSDAEERVERAESRAEQAESRLTRAERNSSRVEDLLEENQSLKNSLRSAQSELSEANTALKRAQDATPGILELQEKLGVAISEKDGLSRKLESTKSELEQAHRENSSLQTRLRKSDEEVARYNKERLSSSNGFASIRTDNWAFLAANSDFATKALVPKYVGERYAGVVVVAAGSEGDNRFVAEYIKSKLTNAYSPTSLESVSDVLGDFHEDSETLLVELTSDTYMDYKLHDRNVTVVNSDGLRWLSGEISATEAIQEASPGIRTITCGLQYVNEAALMNVDWIAKVQELSELDYNVIVSVGCLTSHMRKLVFKRLSQLTENPSMVVTQGVKFPIRQTVYNLQGIIAEKSDFKINVQVWKTPQSGRKLLKLVRDTLPGIVTVFNNTRKDDRIVSEKFTGVKNA